MTYYHGAALVTRIKGDRGRAIYSSMCQAYCVTRAGTGAVGDYDGDGAADAQDGWRKAKAKGKVVLAADIKSYKDIPAGTFAYWEGGSHGYGHVAITIGGGQIQSTDAPTWGRIGVVDIGWIASHWGNGLRFVGYVVIDGNGHRMVDAPAPVEPFTKWFNGLAWNLAGFDSVHGKVSWNTRIPEIVAAIAHYDRDIVHLLEVPNGKATDLAARLKKIGYKIAVRTDGRCVVVRSTCKVGRTRTVTLAERGPADDTKQIVLAEVWPSDSPHAAIIETGHLEYRDGAKYDTTRVIQGRQAKAATMEFAKECGVPQSRIVFYNDENSASQVSAVFGTTFPDLAERDAYTGRRYSTLIGWDGRPRTTGYRPDKVHVHKTRPAKGGTSVTFASSELSDHLPVIYTVGRI